MMTSVLSGGASKHEVVGAVVGSSTGTSITANATPGSDGAWTQLVAATANDWHSFRFFIVDGGAIDDVGLIDFGIGAAGSEVVIVDNVPFQQQSAIARLGKVTAWIPLAIPKGSRVAARIHRAVKASTVTKVLLIGDTSNARALPPYRRATTYGTVLASAIGTTVDPGAVANTQGAMTEIVASTTNPIRSLLVFVTKVNVLAVTAPTSSMLELFIGAAAAEVTLVPEHLSWVTENTGDQSTPLTLGMIPVDVPAGIRIAAKARCNVITANDRNSQVTLVGLD